MTAQHREAGSTDASPALADPPAIAGVGMTAFTGTADRSLLDLLFVAAERALDDAERDPADVDSVHVGNMAAEAFNDRSGLANALAGGLGLIGATARRVENTSASGASAFQSAFEAVASGRSDLALAVGGEKMSSADTATATEIISRLTHDREYEQGVTLPSLGGLAAAAYLEEHGADRRDLARVAVKNHANALANEYAQFRKRIDVDDVLDSPPIASPLRLYDCCPTTDGAAAVVIASDPEDGGVIVTACESATGTHAVADRLDPLEIESVRTAGDRAYAAAGFGPDAVDLACIHDAFSVLEWLEMEELGLAPTGGAWRLTRDGETARDGSIPVNPGGGLKARGHPLGATGIAQVVELVWQLRGDVPDERSVGRARRGLAVNVAGFGNNAVCTLLEVDA
ncbi:thiolase family protein [Halorubrum sp. AD140]|uniref:thiolase family protein n=1 Tax=Halorubrum sp. AD140 TaxID=3050073 RepID=UPI002ACC8E60|nr:thiolase family protein [Halorubrum sp. AD140]MDZ5809949.1 thiolase family protein [Halorubrum sp. AD140]